MKVITTGAPLKLLKVRFFPSCSTKDALGTGAPGLINSNPDDALGAGASGGGASSGAVPTFLKSVRCAPFENTTSVESTTSPGVSVASTFESATSYGIVIAGMKPLISSCLSVTSFRGASIDCTCPCTGYAC